MYVTNHLLLVQPFPLVAELSIILRMFLEQFLQWLTHPLKNRSGEQKS